MTCARSERAINHSSRAQPTRGSAFSATAASPKIARPLGPTKLTMEESHEEDCLGAGSLPDLVRTRVCDLQVGCRGQETRGGSSQELHDKVRARCNDDLRGRLQAKEPRRCRKSQPHEEVRGRRSRHVKSKLRAQVG